ncbi:uncharacterized protein LOC120838008 [Ixodes scapularis]|uniref:uncharacterized protein LOC120838008 n=1 Tax=Ixodes scapularis TaxID=6945 RepID=UPI001C391526|nr:uncharacterized protein LOC120838008 [Ixodes scapularis]
MLCSMYWCRSYKTKNGPKSLCRFPETTNDSMVKNIPKWAGIGQDPGGLWTTASLRRRRNVQVCSEVVHPPSSAHCGRDGAEPLGRCVWDFPSWSPLVGGGRWSFWCFRLHDRLAAPHCRPARTATPVSSCISTRL